MGEFGNIQMSEGSKKLGEWTSEESNFVIDTYSEDIERISNKVKDMWRIAFPNERPEFVNSIGSERGVLWKRGAVGSNKSHALTGYITPRVEFDSRYPDNSIPVWFHEMLHVHDTENNELNNNYKEATTTLLTMLTEKRAGSLKSNNRFATKALEMLAIRGHFREASTIYSRYIELVNSGMEEELVYQSLVAWQHDNDQSFINIWNERVGAEKGVVFEDVSWFAQDNIVDAMKSKLVRLITPKIGRKN